MYSSKCPGCIVKWFCSIQLDLEMTFFAPMTCWHMLTKEVCVTNLRQMCFNFNIIFLTLWLWSFLCYRRIGTENGYNVLLTFTWHGVFSPCLLFGTDFFLWYSCFPAWELPMSSAPIYWNELNWTELKQLYSATTYIIWSSNRIYRIYIF